MDSPEPALPRAPSDRSPVISFVVPAWNEAVHLAGTLESIHAAAEVAGEPYEIIVADDASTDATPEIARAGGAMVVESGARQIAATRNAGARAARGRILIFVDGDTSVGERTVAHAIEAIDAGATYGGAEVRWDGKLSWSYRVLLRLMLRLYRVGGLASGSFLFCTREAFERVGGFDEEVYAAEEVYLSRALRKEGRFAWVREPVVTSGRKLRTYSALEILCKSIMLALRGRRGLTSREHLDLWYAERREDPAEVE